MPTSALVGRDEQLTEILGVLDGPGALTLVVGDAGIGKSRLVSEVLAASPHRHQLSGACLPLTRTLPFLPFVDALDTADPTVRAAVRRALGEVAEPLRPLLSALLPRTLPGSAAADQRTELLREQVFVAYDALLAALASTRPVVLVVEDVHWAESDTLDLLTYLVRSRTSDHRGLHLLATCRADEARLPEQVTAWLENQRRDPRVHEVRLRPLVRREVEVLLTGLRGAVVPPRLLDEVVARGEGNPFFTEQLAASWVDGRDSASSPVPPRLADFLTGRIRTVSPAAQDLMTALCVAGRPLGLAPLARITRLGEEDCLAGLRELARASLVVRDRQGVRPRHALLREALLDDIGEVPGSYHRRVAETLEELGDPSLAAEVAEHYRACGDEVAELRAAQGAAQNAWDLASYVESGRWWERVVELCERHPDATLGRRLPEVYVAAVRACDLAGRRMPAHDLAERARERFHDWPDPLERLRVLSLAAHHVHVNDSVLGRRRFEDLLPLLDQVPPGADVAWALSRYATSFLAYGDNAAAEPIMVRALEAAEHSDDEMAVVNTLCRLSNVRYALGDRVSSLALLARAEQVAARAATGTIALDVAVSVSDIQLREADYPAAQATAERALADARERGLERSWLAHVLVYNAAEAAFERGRTAELGALVDPLTDDPIRPDEDLLTGPRAYADLLRGRRDTALGWLDAPVRSPTRGSETRRQLTEVRTWTLLWLDRPVEAFEAADAALLALAEVDESQNLGWLLCLALQAAADGPGGPEAAAHLLGVRERAMTDPLTPRATWGRGAGEAAQWSAEWTRAQAASDPRSWRAAAAAWERIGTPHRAAYCWWRACEAETDRTRLREALTSAHRLSSGHVLLQREVAALAARHRVPLAVPVNGHPETLPGGLTRQEVKVLRLVAAGLSNQQIGETLVISPKTASVHVSNLLRKLQVANRAQAAAWAEREGLTATEQG